MNNLAIYQQNGAAKVYVPYHKDFPPKIHAIGGIWDKPNQCWWVHINKVHEVREIMQEVFGTDDIHGADVVDLHLTFHEQDGAYRRDYTLYGKVLCHATSHTGGGIAGKDVMYLQKKPESGGSSKNWSSVIPAGSVIRLANVPRKLAEETTLPPHITMEYAVGNPLPDPVALKAEKEELLERVQEIDRLLDLLTDTNI